SSRLIEKGRVAWRVGFDFAQGVSCGREKKSEPIFSSARALVLSIPSVRAWNPRGDILPVRLRRKLFPNQPCLRRDEVCRTILLLCAVVPQHSWHLSSTSRSAARSCPPSSPALRIPG